MLNKEFSHETISIHEAAELLKDTKWQFFSRNKSGRFYANYSTKQNLFIGRREAILSELKQTYEQITRKRKTIPKLFTLV